MPKTKKIVKYSMHPCIEKAFINLHEIFDKDLKRKDYRSFQRISAHRALRRENLLYAAFNFNFFFPTHYFKVCHALQSDKIIGLKNLAAWLRYNPYLTVVDIGCGDGAGSIALVDAVLRLREKNEIDPRPIQLSFVGIDPNPNGLLIYEEMMKEVQKTVKEQRINIAYKICQLSVSEALEPVYQLLLELKNQSNQPSFSHVITIASNVTDILKIQHNKELKKVGLGNSIKANPFGNQLSSFYCQLFEEVPIDHMHILTIDTKPNEIEAAVREMSSTTNEQFKLRNHTIEKNEVKIDQIKFINPPKSFWRNKGKITYEINPFVVSFLHIYNHELSYDNQWQKIISKENLELAWARARQEILRESFSDEIEIRLFEEALDKNIDRLYRELQSYAVDVSYLSPIVKYSHPKSATKDRPRGLTWLEAEILMIAIIQVVGINWLENSPYSFAYRLSSENSIERGATEYLYETWTSAWKNYCREIEKYAKNYPDGIIFKTDIASFYTRIIQSKLQNFAKDKLNYGKRIEWLVEMLIKKEIPDHEPGRGLVQGSIGSGFWANLYLSSVDYLLPINDVKKRRLFRYVDDIVVVIPDPDDEKITKELVELTIKKELELDLNPEKTKIFPTSTYLATIGPDDRLDQLNNCYESLLTPLWQMNKYLRYEFRKCNDQNTVWWSKILLYRSCLTELGLFISESWLSRKISRTICSDENLKAPDLLYFPELPDTLSISDALQWAREFRLENQWWDLDLKNLKADLTALFYESLHIIENKSDQISEHEEAKAMRRLRFASNRLANLGLDTIHDQLIKVLCDSPWYFRDPKYLLENFAIQAYSSAIWKLINYHENQFREMSIYMCAIGIRSIRFIPRLEPEEWERLHEYMFTGDNITKLMATETWLFITSKFDPEKLLNNKQLAERINLFLKSEVAPDRHLLKNYLLILGELDPKEVKRISGNYIYDPLIFKACQIATNERYRHLLINHEPEIIRSKYYSSKIRNFNDGSEEPIS